MNDEVLARTVAESQSERSEIVLPADTNAIGNLFGGRLMQYIDLVAAMAASRHARAFTVTASMDHLDFVAPVNRGEWWLGPSAQVAYAINKHFTAEAAYGYDRVTSDVPNTEGRESQRHIVSVGVRYTF